MRQYSIPVALLFSLCLAACGEARPVGGDAGAPPDLGTDGSLFDGGPVVSSPALTILRPTDGARLGGTEVPIFVRVEGGDASGLSVRADTAVVAGPSDFGEGDAMLTMDAEALDEGRTALVATATIDGEVVESEPVEVIIQWRGPQVFIEGVPTTPVPRGETVVLTLSCSSASCTYDCRLDEGSFEACDSTVVLEELGVGEHRIQVVADDERGRTTVPPAEATFRVAFTWNELAIGARSSCGISSGGALFCWGATDDGRTGTGATDAVVPGPTRVGGSALFEAIAIDRFGLGSRGCAARDDGALLCWGGFAGEAIDETPQVVDADLGATDLAVGGRHLCAIDDAGALRCGGANDQGQLGRDTGVATAAPFELSDDTRAWTHVSVGASHTVGIAGGELWCFGDNSEGACGTGDTDALVGMVRVGADDDWTSVSAGPGYTCGTRDGRVFCWGTDTGGRLGVPPTGSIQTVPMAVTTESGFLAVAVGATFACALRDDGKVWCWGEDDRAGTMGRPFEGPAQDVFAPGEVDTTIPASDIALGARSACLRSDLNGAHCWGTPATEAGDLGLAVPSAVASYVAIDDRWGDVAMTSTHGCGVVAIRSGAGELYCWGLGDDGQLGLDDRIARARPAKVDDSVDWVQVDVAPGQTCARRADERLYCWGDDSHGELGVGAMADRALVPQRVEGRYTSVAVSRSHTCGVRGGQVWCWGSNDRGQLGVGDLVDRAEPTAVGDATDWDWVKVTDGRTCGAHLDGRIECWGLLAQSPAYSATVPTAYEDGVEVREMAMGAAGEVLIDASGGYLTLDRRGAAPALSTSPALGDWHDVALDDGRVCGFRDGTNAYCADDPFDGLTTAVSITMMLVEWQRLYPLPAEAPGGSGCALGGPVRACWGADPRSLHGRGYARWLPLPLRVPRE